MEYANDVGLSNTMAGDLADMIGDSRANYSAHMQIDSMCARRPPRARAHMRITAPPPRAPSPPEPLPSLRRQSPPVRHLRAPHAPWRNR